MFKSEKHEKECKSLVLKTLCSYYGINYALWSGEDTYAAIDHVVRKAWEDENFVAELTRAGVTPYRLDLSEFFNG